MTAVPTSMTASLLQGLLIRKYPTNTHVLTFEVRNGAGFEASNSCDAVAMGTWPSRGCLLSGFEIKVSRNDWLRELKKPHKAEAFYRYLDEFWVVAANDSIVKPDELPATWGLVIPTKNQSALHTVKPAPRLTPEPIERSFLAAILKKTAQQSLREDEKSQIEKSAQANAEQRAGVHLKTVTSELDRLQGVIRTFRAASGIDVADPWTAPAEIGQAVADVLAGRRSDHRRQAKYILKLLHDAAHTIEAAIDPDAPDAEVDALTARLAVHADIFKWLLGEGEFPESEPGRRYNFRSELRRRLDVITAGA